MPLVLAEQHVERCSETRQAEYHGFHCAEDDAAVRLRAPEPEAAAVEVVGWRMPAAAATEHADWKPEAAMLAAAERAVE